MFLEEMGLSESGVVRLIQGAYRLLGLQTFFTAGADECRAWTIRVGDKAPKAAGVIHTDFERGFIRAEVIKYDDFVHYKTEAPRSSSTTTSSTTRPKPPSVPPARWASKARTTSSRMATSCTSCLTCKGPCHIERSFPCHFERSAAKSRNLPT